MYESLALEIFHARGDLDTELTQTYDGETWAQRRLLEAFEERPEWGQLCHLYRKAHTIKGCPLCSKQQYIRPSSDLFKCMDVSSEKG